MVFINLFLFNYLLFIALMSNFVLMIEEEKKRKIVKFY